jgi:hypothetical protein
LPSGIQFGEEITQYIPVDHGIIIDNPHLPWGSMAFLIIFPMKNGPIFRVQRSAKRLLQAVQVQALLLPLLQDLLKTTGGKCQRWDDRELTTNTGT